MSSINLIDTNIFKYFIEDKFEQKVWNQIIFNKGAAYITSATLCEYLVSRMNSPEEVR